MRKFLTTAALALSMTTAAYAAPATDDTIVLQRSGNWTATYHPSNSQGESMCNIYTRWAANNKPVAGLYTKYAPGQNIFIQLFKNGWSMPVGTRVNVTLTFDNSQTYTAVAITRASADDQRFLQFRIADGDEEKFLGFFAELNLAKMSFPDGNEPDWNADMRGSREVVNAFRKCAAYIEKNKPTQPTGPQATQPTQPAPTTQPTQPSKSKNGIGDI